VSVGRDRSNAIPSTIEWHNGQLRILDQRRLPSTVSYLSINTVDDGWNAIRTLAIRGAPAIGIAAAYTLAVAMAAEPANDPAAFLAILQRHSRHLQTARPTAVNLRCATERICTAAQRSPDLQTVRTEAQAIHAEDRSICHAIGEHGKHLITPRSTVLTHCNAGALAVSELGTVTAPMYLSHADGTPFRVYVDETRPLLQGARLTAWELTRAGIEVVLICDNVAASIMAAGKVDLVIVGTDRVTRNGDVANKIGTLNLAVLCRYFRIPFYVALPSTSYDPHTETGDQVVIEHRPAEEVLGDKAAHVRVHNPAFDITPADLVTAFITDFGMIEPPFEMTLPKLSSRESEP
jgi:methylthioribose-1-phosphate isomerase